MIIIFFFLILIPIFILMIKKMEKFQTRGYIMADINSNKDVKVDSSLVRVSDRINGKEICIDNVCLTKNELKMINTLHPKLKRTVCINNECNYKKHFGYLKKLWPIGSIVMYGGDLERLPDGWQICDGSMGTPDLRDKFILGGDKNYKYTYELMGHDMCSNKQGVKPSYYFEKGPDFVNKCKAICNNYTNCFGYNKSDTTCILWTEELSETTISSLPRIISETTTSKAFPDLSKSKCYKKNTHGGDNEHTLKLSEIPPHNHLLQSYASMSGTGSSKGLLGDVSKGNSIIMNGNDFHNLLSFSGDNVPHENKPPFVSLYYVMKIDPNYKESPIIESIIENKLSREDVLREQIREEPISQVPVA